MPGVTMSDSTLKKRKRVDPTAAAAAAAADAIPHSKTAKPSTKSSKKSKKSTATDDAKDPRAHILLMEAQILESKKHYNNISTLLKSCEDDSDITAAVALCRVFCRLIAAERMVKHQGMPDAELEAADWLKTALKQYITHLCRSFTVDELQSTTLTLLMRLVKEETRQEGKRGEQAWRTGIFASVVRALVDQDVPDAVRDEFVEKYLEEHDDVRYFTFYHVAYVLSAVLSHSPLSQLYYSPVLTN